jgi:Fe-S cluster biogenesis protein NfuA
MPCDTMIRTQRERAAREAAIKKLAEEIERGEKTIVQNWDGTVEISDWNTTDAAAVGWCEGCAMEWLGANGSWEVQSQLAAVGVSKGAEFVAASHRGHSHKVR